MRHLQQLVLLGIGIQTAIAASEPSRPRGVGPEFAKFYKNPSTFTCISHPSIVLPFHQVNDDYCDCPDGSDEPGTAACTFLSPLSPPQPQPVPASVTGTSNLTLALPGYYCKNKGHRPAYLPFTYLNDGICDYDLCCDGSDEWAQVGGRRCEDRCQEMGKAYKKQEAERERAAYAAGKKRAELVRSAAGLKAAVVAEAARIEEEIRALEAKHVEAKRKYDDAERRERGRVVSGASTKATKTTILAGLAKSRIEELREALVSTIDKKDIARGKVQELEKILEAFREEYNPNFNDKGVKKAVQAWEDYAAARDSMASPLDAEERDLDEIVKADTETNGINWADWAEEEESDVEALYRFEEYLPMPARIWLHEKVRDLRVLLVQNGILADHTPSGSESKLVTDARAAVDLVDTELLAKRSQLGDKRADLERAYGPDGVFRALQGRCVAQEVGEYTYELCWLDKTTQKSRKGGGGGAHTGLGHFVRLDTTEVDDEVAADGTGLGRGRRWTMVFENGQHCWNGPNRATTVVMACAETDAIWRVVELEKCIYRMEVGTPAVCEGAAAGGDGNAGASGSGSGSGGASELGGEESGPKDEL